MREYILTDREKEIVKTYLEKGQRLEGFSVLVSRCKTNLSKINEDLKLITKFLEKAEK